MNAPENRRLKWTPPVRPEWVARLNQEGAHLDIKGIVPLDAQSLIDTAIANTGLSNFGAEDWREPFELICRGLDGEAALNLMGRIMTRSDMLMLLEARLQVEEAYRQHPEIEDEEIVAPILIIGQGRSGTSALVNLLAADPENAVLLTWRALFPAPAAATPDPRFEIADQRMTMWSRVTPEINAMHEFTGAIPTETIQAEALSFQQPAWQVLLGQNPSHYRYMAEHSMVPALAYGKRVLKLLQWQNPKKHWVLKSPDTLNYLPALLEVYPDVNLVFLHRDPIVSIASMVSLVGTLSWIRSDQILPEGTFEAVTDPKLCAEMLVKPIDLLESGRLRKEQLHSILYNDFVADPIGTAESIYRHFGRPFTDAARSSLRDYTVRHPRTSRPPHRYDTGDQAVISQERQAFRRYQEFFGVPSEV